MRIVRGPNAADERAREVLLVYRPSSSRRRRRRRPKEMNAKVALEKEVASKIGQD